MSKTKVLKIIHIADVHIRTFRLHVEYREIFEQLLTELKELVNGYERDEVRIVIVGDLVHQKITISNELLTLGTWFLKELQQIAPLRIVAGNHDFIENNKDRMDSITPMVNLLSGLDIQYYKGESFYHEDSNIVWCNYSIFDGCKRPDIEGARTTFGDDKTYIGLYHAPLIGLKTDIGYEFDSGNDVSIFNGCDIVLCGDIHKRQTLYNIENAVIDSGEMDRYSKMNWTLSTDIQDIPNKIKVRKNIPVSMPSSLIQQNFGETVSNHGFLWWDIESRTFEEHNLETKFGYYQFKIKSMDDLENNGEKIINL